MEFKINITYLKLLETINFFNNNNLAASQNTLLYVLNGTKELLDELSINSPTFETLTSITGRKLKSKIKMLNRYKLVRYIYSRNYEEPFLELTELGKIELIKYKQKHKINYKKRTIKSNNVNYINLNDPSIIKL